MISFRYHVVSIVAVFLALATGILLGSTLLNGGLADRLDQQVKSLSGSLDRQRSALSDLEQRLQVADTYMTATLPSVVAGRLTNQPVVIVTEASVDLSALSATRQALSLAGATLSAVIEIRTSITSTKPADQSRLAQALGLTGATPPADLLHEAANAFAGRLTHVPVGSTDVLDQLAGAGFLSVVDQSSAGIAGVGVQGQTVVIVSGSSAPAASDPAIFLVPVAEALVATQPPTPVVAAEPQGATSTLVPALRASDVNGTLVTVDDVDLTYGQYSVVVGLQDLIRDPGRGANYGLGPGATAPFPPP